MSAYLPAVTPAFDMRRRKRRTQFGGNLLDQLLPYLPVFFIVCLDLRNAFRLVFFKLGKLEKRDIEQIATFWGQHSVFLETIVSDGLICGGVQP